MAIKLILGVVCLVVLVLLECSLGQQSNSQCQQTYVNNAMKCVQNGSVNYQHLLFLTTNRTRGSQPPEGPEAFKARACLSRPTIDSCGRLITATMMNSSVCLNQIEQKQLQLTAASIFGEYDRVCAHPCRYTLLEELRQCFSFNIQSGLNWQTFLTDASVARGGIIGSTREQVYQFCQNQRAMTSCMNNKINMCPDGQYMMQKMKIDIRSLTNGLDLLCTYPNVYLHGLTCYTDPKPAVRMCFREMDTKLNQMTLLGQHQSLTDQQMYMQECGIRLSLMECEIGAWKSTRPEAPCDHAVLGLRNELECKLLPDYCMRMFPSLVQTYCTPQNFHIEERARYAGAATNTITLSALLVLLFVAVSARS